MDAYCSRTSRHEDLFAYNPSVYTFCVSVLRLISQSFLGLYVDGNPSSTLNATYPKPSPPPTTFHLGCDPAISPRSRCRWSLACAHLLALPLSGDLTRLIHRLGPRYVGNFQDTSLFRFLTYEASTSLNIHIFENTPAIPVNATGNAAPEGVTLAKALTGGIGFSEEQILFTLSPKGVTTDPMSGSQTVVNAAKDHALQEAAELKGDVCVCPVQCMDIVVWRLGGPAIPLRLIEIALVWFASFFVTEQVHLNTSIRHRRTWQMLWPSYQISCVQVGKIQKLWRVSVRP